ncbi:peptidoglycan DD-metalloendopeptidase family protein [Desulfopila sp. IMCC35008]|uniref:peptidoglycan DD-metalloendopeptidase family protein n=1 Tax=Desulfopila sp. IMCC35008 TaxID=2653858 RepID=UPI0013D7E01E|nr:peptidoglycan DD-metalloendopeptidase family protein [Desulfopila sp. IMCC35008]
MYYPFFLYSSKIKHYPIFQGLRGDPYIADMSPESPILAGIDVRDQEGFQRILDDKMRGQYHWGVASYLEKRDTLLGDCPQMVADKRFIHLGLDIIVDLGTPLHAPLDATVAESGYESGEGNYGGYVLLRHESPHFKTFFSFYGHLRRDSLPEQGAFIAGGLPFAEIGDFHENGNWFYHTHLQVITDKGVEKGYTSKGYCSERDLVDMNDLCPSPLPLFII